VGQAEEGRKEGDAMTPAELVGVLLIGIVLARVIRAVIGPRKERQD